MEYEQAVQIGRVMDRPEVMGMAYTIAIAEREARIKLEERINSIEKMVEKILQKLEDKQ